MPRNCCGAGSCACSVQGELPITVTGTGTADDPFVVSADLELTGLVATPFQVAVGPGADSGSWEIEVTWSPDAAFSDLPQVSTSPPANGEVLTWNDSTGEWEPASGTTAPVGAVSHDTTLTGDGSVGTPLGVAFDPDRFIEAAVGVGLTNEAINSLVRRFPNSVNRDAADPAPEVNTISALDSDPGRYDRWDGTEWVPLEELPLTVGGQFLQLSGAYTGGRVRTLVKQVSFTTDGAGSAVLLTSSDFDGAAGVLAAHLQETGTVPYKALLATEPGLVTVTAYRLDNGAAFTGQPLTGVVTALFY